VDYGILVLPGAGIFIPKTFGEWGPLIISAALSFAAASGAREKGPPLLPTGQSREETPCRARPPQS
jgi:hypothetical protein